MREELDKQLCKDFPEIFRDRNSPSSKTCMCWGFPGDGWEPIIREICEKLTKIRYETGMCFFAEQVKEKFGTLRFYTSEDIRLLKISEKKRKEMYDLHNDIMDDAEEKSSITCELCGKPGKPTRGGWIITICEKCERNKWKKNEI